MNPFRAAVVRYLSEGGAGEPAVLCARFNHMRRYLRRDLQLALDAGVLSVDDDDEDVGVYRFVPQASSLVNQLIAICHPSTYYNKWIGEGLEKRLVSP